MCGRPYRSKRNLQERSSAWSGADMCAALDAARSMPRAQMGVRRSGPIQAHALAALVAKLVVPIRSLDRSLSLSCDPPTSATTSRSCRRRHRRNRSSINSTARQQCPDNPGHLVGQRHPHQHRGLRASMRPSHEPAGTPLRASLRASALAPMIGKPRRVYERA